MGQGLNLFFYIEIFVQKIEIALIKRRISLCNMMSLLFKKSILNTKFFVTLYLETLVAVLWLYLIVFIVAAICLHTLLKCFDQCFINVQKLESLKFLKSITLILFIFCILSVFLHWLLLNEINASINFPISMP